MVRHRVEIQRLCQLYFKSAGVHDCLALRVAIGVCRCGGGAKTSGIKGESRMYVQVAKVSISIRIDLLAIWIYLRLGGE